MSAIERVREEEREARERERNLARARKIQARQRQAAMRRQIREAARELRQRFPGCKCNFAGVRTSEQLRAMRGCCDPVFACPVLDGVRREVAK